MKSQKIKDIAGFEKPPSISPENSIRELINKFLELTAIHQFYVLNKDDTLMGIIGRKKIFHTLYHHYLHPSTRISKLYQMTTAEKVEGIIDTHFYTAKPEDLLIDVLKTMLEHDIIEIPVVDSENRLIGKLDQTYFFRFWLNQQKGFKKEN